MTILATLAIALAVGIYVVHLLNSRNKARRNAGDWQAQLLAKEMDLARWKEGNAHKHSDPIVNQALAAALNLLSADDAATVERLLYPDDRDEDTGGDPEHVSGPSGPATIPELEDVEPG